MSSTYVINEKSLDMFMNEKHDLKFINEKYEPNRF